MPFFPPPILFPLGGSSANGQPLGTAAQGTSRAAARLDHVHPTRFAVGVAATNAPVNNGDLTLEFTANTTVTIKGKGSDGTIRSGTVTLA